MATYFHGNTEIQAPDGLQTLLLMNPTAYVQYSDTPPPPPPPTSANHFVFLNSAANSLSTHNHLPHHHAPISSHTQQFVGIPLPTSAAPNHHDLPNITSMHGFINPAHLQYNLWNPNINNEPSTVARDSPRSQQGLSLSLSSSQHPLPPLGYGSIRDQRKGSLTQSAQQAISNDHDMRNISGGSSSSASGITNGVSGLQGVLLSTKYLKAAQDLLDEVVNVGNDHNGIKKGSNIGQQSKEVGEGSGRVAGDGSAGMLADGKNSSELSTAERQEIQMKKAKLIGMLDEVEQRYRQYHHQMHIIISSFEQAAGIGSAKTYTALALETISRQFRCLKDTITSQIKTANKTLGEEDNGLSNGGGKIEGSRLKYVDHQLRQQRALQQLGMIQHNAWRPQRGLPERSVSVLRAWLFEHFLHPYPKDSDKTMLAKQTGLTRSQVSNWFINARVRLWKPMVEEMYLEEIKEQEQSNTNIGGVVKSNNEGSPSKSITSQGKSTSTPPTHDHQNQLSSFNSKQENPPEILTPPKNLQNQSGFSLIGSSELEGITQSSPKKQRNSDHVEATNEHNMSMKFNENHRQSSRDEFSFMGGQTNFIGGFGQYPIGEIDTRFNGDDQFAPRFTGNNGVSLTLGLPHCENLSLSEAHQGFLQNQSIRINGTRRVVDNIGEQDEFSAMNGTNGSSVSHSSTAFENINIQNRKRFAAQLLHDFVA